MAREGLTRELVPGVGEDELYRLAVDLLIEVHRRFSPAQAEASGLQPYDDERFLEEAALLTDWYLPAIDRPTSARDRLSYVEAWNGVLPVARRVPDTLVLRDYHVDNLMVLEGRPGIAGCGLLDFQDAVQGPLTYDLVSLLEDVRRDVSTDLVTRMRERYLAARPEVDRTAFDASYAVLGAQRNAKIIGIFTRLWKRDGKPAYLPHIARVWRLLEGDLEHPALAGVRDWFDEAVPPALRRVPDAGATT